MLFEFHPHFDNFAAPDWQPLAEHLTNLLAAHRAGKHYFVGSRALLGSLAQCDFLGHVSLTTVKDIAAKHIDLMALRNALPRTVEICDFLLHAPSGGPKRRPLPISALLQHETLDVCQVLVEHSQNDGGFWQLIFDANAAIKGPTVAMPGLKFVHCGGQTMSDVLANHLQHKTPMYVLVDSDKRSKWGAAGSTAKAVDEVLVKSGYMPKGDYGLSSVVHWLGYRVLSVREAENLIPLDFAELVLDGKPGNCYAIVKKVAPSEPGLSSAQDKEIWSFYDVKTAQSVEGIAYACPDEKKLFDTMVARVGAPLPAVRERLLRDVIDFCSGKNETQGRRALAKALGDSPFFPVIEEIANELFTLSCRPRSRLV